MDRNHRYTNEMKATNKATTVCTSRTTTTFTLHRCGISSGNRAKIFRKASGGERENHGIVDRANYVSRNKHQAIIDHVFECFLLVCSRAGIVFFEQFTYAPIGVPMMRGVSGRITAYKLHARGRKR